MEYEGLCVWPKREVRGARDRLLGRKNGLPCGKTWLTSASPMHKWRACTSTLGLSQAAGPRGRA